MNDESQIGSNEFRVLFEIRSQPITNGIQNASRHVFKRRRRFSRSIGATAQEIFDFVEDWCDDGVPDPETVLAHHQDSTRLFHSRATGAIS